MIDESKTILEILFETGEEFHFLGDLETIEKYISQVNNNNNGYAHVMYANSGKIASYKIKSMRLTEMYRLGL